MELFAKNIIDNARLGVPTGPYQHEIEQGHWDIPLDAQRTKIHFNTCKRLFKDWPQWALMCVFNPLHYHDGKKVGAWWIFEANPSKIPRQWHPAFPLCVRRFPDGSIWIDRDNGTLVNPDECYEVILKTLKVKDVYNPNVHADVADPVRNADKHNDARKDVANKKLDDFNQQFMNDVVFDETAKIFVPRSFEE